MASMASDLARHIGLAHKVFKQGELVGFTPSEWNALAENPTLFDAIHDVVLGNAEIKPVPNTIDCNAMPFCPKDWTVEERNLTFNKLNWRTSKITLYVSENQKSGRFDSGNKLRTEMYNKAALPANVLDFLLANPHLISEAWKEKTEGKTTYIYFWGTIYRHSNGSLCVRCLYWCGDGWLWTYDSLGNSWDGNSLAALCAG